MVSRPRLREPGLLRLEPGMERYRVRGGGATVLALAAGDQMTITDIEGRQRCELALFSPEGLEEDAASLGARADGRSDGLAAMLSNGGEDAQGLLAALSQHRIDVRKSRVVQLFGGEMRSGDQECFTAERDAICVVTAPGKPMRVDEQDPPTDLKIMVKRAKVAQAAEIVLPLLAEPRLDLRVLRASARAYEVRAGEYIQVIDVAGRQCSDFLAFNSRHLQRGVERGLDATTTRTLMGAAYPRPGLYSKFFDQDMQPLVEVVRDTVGRHDTFALACTPKYYEDMGYPGHANCTDNFNASLASYGVAPRRGWPAINFFYNTGIDSNNVLFLDEPWSRPGDYVLLKALTDLVCASSACPDDIDPANGWNPTDIHVRIYPATGTFSKGVAYRMTPDADAQLTQETAFHPRTSALTRNFVIYRGYWLPASYTGHNAIEEYYACRERAVVMDLSPLRKFEVLGPDAEALLQWTVTRNVRRLSVGQVVYTAMCYDTGGMLDDGTIFRLGPNNFRWIGGDDFGGLWLRQQAEKLGLRVWVKSSTDQLHNIAVQGPLSRDILKAVVWTPPNQPKLEELTWFRFCVGRVSDMNGAPILVSRTGYSGELGYEVWCHPKDALVVWDAVWEAGQAQVMLPLGLEALDMLRVESGLVFAGYEFDDQVDPFEAGIGFTVDLKTKEEEFMGKQALIPRKEHPQRILVGLELEGNEPAAHGDCVHVGRSQVGVVTSGTRSPLLRKNIALCRMAVEYSAIGIEVEIGKLDGHQKRIPATVVRFPFYDPEKKRPRS
ncbi:MAG: aminomethyltransferase family protein [Acidobacteria bacterium]|nr:aminomethyltransferase family protein [Acidobacteriota bacterium]